MLHRFTVVAIVVVVVSAAVVTVLVSMKGSTAGGKVELVGRGQVHSVRCVCVRVFREGAVGLVRVI